MLLAHKAEAFVLKKTEILERDTSITLFTRELGKVRAIAKGVKKMTSRRAPHLQTANLLDLELNQRHDIYYVQQTFLITGFAQLKDDPVKLNYVYVFFFVLDRVLPENVPEEGVFQLTKRFLADVSRSNSFNTARLGKYLQMVLQNLGYLEDSNISFSEVIQVTEDIIREKIPVRIL